MFERILYHSGVTFLEMGGGMGLAVLASIPLSWLMFRFRFARAITQPLFIYLQCLPMFVLAPLFVIVCGWSYWAIILPTALMIVFPLTMNLYKGILSVPDSYVQFFRGHGASRWKELMDLRIPYAMPQVFAGLRIAAGVAGVGAVAGEWAGGQAGLGVYIQMCRRAFDLEGVFCGIGALMVLSMVFYGSVALLERCSMRWRCV